MNWNALLWVIIARNAFLSGMYVGRGDYTFVTFLFDLPVLAVAYLHWRRT